MSETEALYLAATARLLGSLLQRELDESSLVALRSAGADRPLLALGLELPTPRARALLDARAAEFFDLFVAPKDGPPLVQSLAETGAYEGEPAAAIRALADRLGLDRDESAARGAPVDHLGSELEIWAEISTRAPDHAQAFARNHLLWSLPHLEKRSRAGGFYGRLCAVVADFIADLAS